MLTTFRRCGHAARRRRGRGGRRPTSASERVCQAANSVFRVATTRETALFESGASLSRGWRAPRIRRVLPPAKYVAITASLTSGIRRLIARHDRRRPFFRAGAPEEGGPEVTRAQPGQSVP